MERPLSGLSVRAFARPLALSKALSTLPLLPQGLRLGISRTRVQDKDSSPGTGEVKTAWGGELGSESGEERQEDCQ